MRRCILVFLLLIFACERKGNFVRVDFKLDGTGGIPTYVSSITLSVEWESALSPITDVIPIDTLEKEIMVPAGEKRVFKAYANVYGGTPVLFGTSIKDILPGATNNVDIYLSLIEFSGFVHDPLGDSKICDINGVLVKKLNHSIRVDIWVAPNTNLENVYFYLLLDLDQNSSTYIGSTKGEIGPDAGIVIYAGGVTGAYIFNEWTESGEPLIFYSSSFPGFVTGNRISVDIPVSAFGNEDGLMNFIAFVYKSNTGVVETTGTGKMVNGSTLSANPFYKYSNGIISIIAGSTLGDKGDAINSPLGELSSMVVDGNEIVYLGSFSGRGFLRKIDLSTGKIYNLAGIITPDPDSFIEAEFPIPVTIPSTARIYKDGEKIFLSDSYDCTIKELDLITKSFDLIAGIPGQCGYNGDGSANSVPLNNPTSLFVQNGEIYFSDTGNNLIRKISNGYVQTIAGDYSSYPCDSTTQAFYGGQATLACLSSPSGIFPDGLTGFYIADTGNYLVRYVDFYSGNISTIAGNGSYGSPISGIGRLSIPFTGPEGVFLWQDKIFIIDAGLLYYIDMDIYIFQFSPSYFSVAYPSNYLYVYSEADNSIGYFSSLTNPVFQKLAGSPFSNSLHGGDGGDALYSSLEDPRGLAVYNGEVYFLENRLHSLYKVSSGKLLRIAGNGQPQLCTLSVQISADNPAFYFPQDLSIGPDGKLYVADGDCTVKVVDFSMNEIRRFGGNCECSTPQDGKDALSSPLLSLTSIETGSDGSIFLSMTEALTSYIYSIDQSKILHHIGGNPNGLDVFNYTGPTDARNVNFGYIYFLRAEKENPFLYVGTDYAIWRIDLRTNMAELFIGGEGGHGGWIIEGSPPYFKSALMMNIFSDIFPIGGDLFIGSSYSSLFGFNRYTSFRIAGNLSKSGFRGMNGRSIDSLIYYPAEVFHDGKDIYLLLYDYFGGRILKISPLP